MSEIKKKIPFKTGKEMDKMLEKVIISLIELREAYSCEVMGTSLAFQQRHLAFGIRFHGELVTKGPPPKCFQAYRIVFFLLGCTGTGSHNDLLFIVKNPLCVDGTRVT